MANILNGYPGSHLGMRIIVDDGHLRFRGLRERWLSWPWRPWRQHEFVAGPADGEIVGDPCGGVMVMNSHTRRTLEKELEKADG